MEDLMSSEQIVLLGLFINSLVTILGWAITASVQRRILKETLKGQQLERELAIFRERLAMVRGITSTLLDQSASYNELIVIIVSGHFDFEKGAKLIQSLNVKAFELAKILYDPALRSIRDLLPKDNAEGLYNQLKMTNEMIATYHASAAGLNPFTPKLDVALHDFADQALEISRQLIKTANMFADGFAFLDKTLATDHAPQPSALSRLLLRLRVIHH
jgi:hypothetical protein